MRSNRLAILAVGVGSALLGWATAGVHAVAGDLSRTSAPPAIERTNDHSHHPGHGHRGV